MKVNKKAFFKIHSWIGVRLSILFFIVCFSGTLATLSHEMDWLFNPDARATPQEQLAPRNLIVENFATMYPNGKMTYWMRTDEPYLCDVIYKMEDDRRSYVFANPYTGEIQGETQLTIQRFFRDMHYFLFIPVWQIGNYLVLIFGFLLLISLVTALLFYKEWWRKLFVLQTGKGALVFFRSLHRLIGLWSTPFTLLFSITGIWYFVERANIAGVRDKANPKPPQMEALAQSTANDAINFGSTVDYDRAVAIAQEEIPNLVVGDLLPPQKASDYLYLTGKSDVPLVRQRANRAYIDPNTYELVSHQRAENISTTMWLNDIADPLHFGYWGGLVTKVIWFILGMGISSLVLSGIWITLKRKAVKRKRSDKKVMGVWWYINWGICVVIWGFMYVLNVAQYKATFSILLTMSIGWLLFVALAYYIFAYRLNRSVNRTLSL